VSEVDIKKLVEIKELNKSERGLNGIGSNGNKLI